MTDTDHVVLELDRGSRGKLKICRSVFKGSAPYTKLQLWYPADDSADAELLPGKVVTIKDHELAQVIGVLIAIDKKQYRDKLGEPAPAVRPAQHRTIRVTEQESALDRKLF